MEKEKEIVAWVGLDWADQQHEICLQKVGEESVHARIAGHASTRTTQLCNRSQEALSLDEIERIQI